jgi:hypothetical protein
VRRGGARRNNTNDFLAIYLEPCVNHNQNRPSPDGPEGDTAFFLVGCLVALRQGARVVEHKNSGFETNIVLAQVPLALVFVPFKAHGRRPI